MCGGGIYLPFPRDLRPWEVQTSTRLDLVRENSKGAEWPSGARFGRGGGDPSIRRENWVSKISLLVRFDVTFINSWIAGILVWFQSTYSACGSFFLACFLSFFLVFVFAFKATKHEKPHLAIVPSIDKRNMNVWEFFTKWMCVSERPRNDTIFPCLGKWKLNETLVDIIKHLQCHWF